MNWVQSNAQKHLDLQATLSVGSAEIGQNPILPHHPITCKGSLALEEDGVMSCDHAKTVTGDTRTQHCINGSISWLLIELVKESYPPCPDPESFSEKAPARRGVAGGSRECTGP